MAGPTQISQNRYIQSGNEAGNFNYQGLPPEEAMAQRALARKQQIANLLMTQGVEQAGQNNGQMVGRFYVPGSAWQNVAGLGQIVAGALGSHALDQQGEALQASQGAMRGQALEDYMKKTTPQAVHAPAEGPGAPVPAFAPEEVNPNAHNPEDYQQILALQQEGPRPTSPAPTMQPVDPAVAKVAQAQLATSTDPYLRQYAMGEMQRQGQADERGLQREFLKSQNEENRQNRLDVAQQGFGKDMVLATMMGANKDQLAQMQRAHEMSLESVRGANRKEVAQIGADARGSVADTKAAKAEEEKATGVKTVNSLVTSLRDQFTQLQQGGGITDTDKGPLGNVGAGIASSGPGQTAGTLFGTKNQSLRNTIAQQRPILLQAIKSATGMTAKQMDSNVELKLYLSMATDPQLDIQTNMKALDMIETLFGGGGGAAPTGTIPAPSGKEAGSLTPAEQAELDTLKKKYGR